MPNASSNDKVRNHFHLDKAEDGPENRLVQGHPKLMQATKESAARHPEIVLMSAHFAAL